MRYLPCPLVAFVVCCEVSSAALACASTEQSPGCQPCAATGALVASVEARDFAFFPGIVIIPQDASVRWISTDPSFTHTSTSTASPPLWSSGLFSLGQSFEHQFAELGEFHYECVLHSEMSGTVNVRGLGDATGDNRTDISDFAILAANFNLRNRTYITGDFDLTGTTDIGDFAVLAANFNRDFSRQISIPEPLFALPLASFAMCIGRRRT